MIGRISGGRRRRAGWDLDFTPRRLIDERNEGQIKVTKISAGYPVPLTDSTLHVQEPPWGSPRVPQAPVRSCSSYIESGLKVAEIDLQKNNGTMWLISRLKVGERYIIKLNSGG